MANDGSVRALILAGGSGTRLWPLSTDERPKPFLPLAGTKSLLLQTYERAVSLVGEENVLLSARAAHAGLLRRELPSLPEERMLLEPVRRNTAPAIALAALAVSEDDPGGLLAVLPSDQAVRDEGAFLAALKTAVEAAREDAFVTLGIPPTRAETGFGYLEAAPAEGASSVRRVLRFVEKPGEETAARYAASGRHFWNAGIFVFRTALFLRELERLRPDILVHVRRAFEARLRGDRAGSDVSFAAAPSISIDYALMEKAEAVAMVPCDCGWSDLGSWEAVYEFRGGGGSRDVLEGPATVRGGSSNLVLASERQVRVIGLSELVVVDAPEGVLVMRRGASDALRESVEESLKEAKA